MTRGGEEANSVSLTQPSTDPMVQPLALSITTGQTTSEPSSLIPKGPAVLHPSSLLLLPSWKPAGLAMPLLATCDLAAYPDVWQSVCDDPNPIALYRKGNITHSRIYWGPDPNGQNFNDIPLQNYPIATYYDPAPMTSSGVYYLRQSTYGGGQWSNWVTHFTFKYDALAPANPSSASLVGDGAGCSGLSSGVWQSTCNDPNFSWSGASDAHSGLQGFYVYFGPSSTGEPTIWTTTAGYNPGPVTAGSHYLRVKTRDAAGNISQPVTLFVLNYGDIQPPTNPSLTGAGCASGHHNTWQHTCAQPSFTWAGASDDASGVKGYYYYWGPSDTVTPTTWTTATAFNPTGPVSSGSVYHLRLKTEDHAGRQSSPVTLFTLKYENQAPTVNLSLPRYQGATSFPVAWNGTDTGGSDLRASGPYTVQYQVNNGPSWQSWYTSTHLTSAQFITATDNTTYTFQVQAADNAGNVSVWATAVTTIDTNRPSVTAYAPIGTITTTTPTLSGQFVTGASPIELSTVRISLDGQVKAGASITSGGFSLPLSPALIEGAHQATVSLTNTANLTGQTVWYFTTDSLPPTVTLTVPSAAGLNISIAWQGSDTGTGIDGYDVQYKVGSSVSWTGWLSNVTQTAASFQGTSGYSYTFRVRATDEAGNVGNWQEKGPVEVNAVTKYYLFGSQRVAMRQGNLVYYLHGDHLGSTSLTTDAGGQKISESRYLPYGQIRFGNTGPTDFGFTSQRKDSYMELYDYGAKWYDPEIGRFLST